MSKLSKRYAVRICSQTLVDAVGGANGEQSQPSILTEKVRTMLISRQTVKPGFGFRAATFICYLTPTVPANRRVSIYPQVMIYENDDPILNVAGQSVSVFLQRMILMDVL
jgi:hypothetical protein